MQSRWNEMQLFKYSAEVPSWTYCECFAYWPCFVQVLSVSSLHGHSAMHISCSGGYGGEAKEHGDDDLDASDWEHVNRTWNRN